MKKIFFLTIGIMMCALVCFAQQSIQSKMFSLQLPTTASKSSKEQIAKTQNKFHHSEINKNSKNVFQIGDILITSQDNYFDKFTSQSLESWEKAFVGLNTKFNKNIVITDTSIIRINNAKVLVIKYHDGDDYFFRAYTDLYKNTSTAAIASVTNTTQGNTSILVQCKKDDEPKATLIFNNILKSIKLTQ